MFNLKNKYNPKTDQFDKIENAFIQVYRESDNFWLGDFTPEGVQKIKAGKYLPELRGVGFYTRRNDGNFIEVDGSLHSMSELEKL